MMGKKFRYILLILAIFSLPLAVDAQRGQKTKKSKKEFEEKKEERAEAELKAQEEGIKRHRSIQDKEVRKRMKRNERRAKRRRKGKPEDPFFRRLFTRG